MASKKITEVVQIIVRRPKDGDSKAYHEMVTLVDASWKLKKGQVISFEGLPQRWKVEFVGARQMWAESTTSGTTISKMPEPRSGALEGDTCLAKVV
jgi:hypothetical protein